jgi:hypothetical protein
MYHLLGIVRMKFKIGLDRWDHAKEDKHGLGGAHMPELFHDIYRIDIHVKVTEQHLGRFIELGQMHNHFMMALWHGNQLRKNLV